jgi:hypothetical protein
MIRLNLSADLRRALERLQPGSAKIFGSSLWFTERVGDIDIAVPDDDDATFAYLLNVAPAFNLHPVRMARWLYDDLHNRLSWKNMCGTQDARTGEVTLSKDYVHSDLLQFNPASRKAFPDFVEVRRAAKKMEERGYRVPDSEKARASLQLLGSLSSLDVLARLALTDRIVNIIAALGGVVAGGFFRDEVDGRTPKDIDVFVPAGRDWNALCLELSTWLEEVDFEKPEGKRVNLRKFRAKSDVSGYEMLVIDVIDYGFVHEDMHVVETFDFSCNTLWWSPAGHAGVQGGFGLSAREVIGHIRERKLVVGDNLWYRAGLYRALKRWQRFRGDGYVADAANTAKYSEYVRLFAGK